MHEVWYYIEQWSSFGWSRIKVFNDPTRAQEEGDRLATLNPLESFRLVKYQAKIDLLKEWVASRG